MANTTMIRKSTIPESFKFRVEEKAPTFIHPGSKEQICVQIGLNPNPETHACTSVDIFGCLMMGCAQAMSNEKFKNKDKSALVFNKADNGEVIAAVISDYDKEGENYFYNITFDSADVKGIKNVINYRDFIDKNRNLNFGQLVNAAYCTQHNTAVTDYNVLDIMIICAWETLYQWLDLNAKDGEIVELVIDDYIGRYEFNLSEEEYLSRFKPVAIASVETSKDVKKMSIQFAEELKAIAKGSNDMNS